METLLYGWPFFALGAGLVGLVLLWRSPRVVGAVERHQDPSWLVCTMLPLYMIHQFEEHGFDALGRRYHFIRELCGTLGHRSLETCPADPWFILAVNAGAVWIAGVCAIVWREKNPLVGACAFGIPLVNGFAHLVPAVKHQAYNSGLVTAVLVFLPLSIHALRTMMRDDILERPRVPFIIITGGVLHGILLGGLLAYDRNVISRGLMLAIQVANGFLPLIVGTLLMKMAQRKRASLR